MSRKFYQTCLTNAKFLKTARVGDIFSWSEVSEIHQVRNGIYQRNGKLVSLLTDFGKINPCYPDVEGDTTNTIFYTGAGRRGDQRLDSFNRTISAELRRKKIVLVVSPSTSG